MFGCNMRMDEIKNMEHFLEGIEAASLENEFSNYIVGFKDRDRDFRLGYIFLKSQYYKQRQKRCYKCNSIIESKDSNV